jgi:hypothetical protein
VSSYINPGFAMANACFNSLLQTAIKANFSARCAKSPDFEVQKKEQNGLTLIIGKISFFIIIFIVPKTITGKKHLTNVGFSF